MDRVQKKKKEKKNQNDNKLFLFVKKKREKEEEIENRRRDSLCWTMGISFRPLSRGVESKDGRPLEIEWGVRRG